MGNERIKLAVVGGHRGASFAQALEALSEQAELTAICDLAEDVRLKWKERYPHIQTFASYDELLERGDCTAVFICTPLQLHAAQAVQALEAGKDVLSEVVAATTLDDCWRLVETVEKTGRTYMLAENYCYMRANMMVLNMVEQGVFGETTYAEGAYIHDCRALLLNEQNEFTWRARLRLSMNGNTYPTHSLGPVAQWLRVNRAGGDRLDTTATWMSPSRAVAGYIRERLGESHAAARDEYWTLGDSATTVIQTEKGSVIVLRVDWASPRPHNMTHYALQGTRAAYISARRHHEREDDLIWIDGMSPGSSPTGDAQWEPLWKYADQYEHPYWRAWRVEAERAGHGGGDFFILRDFFTAVQSGSQPPIDVYDAVTWSSIVPLSAESVARGGTPVEVPRFRR
jgi:predicted dehydrogenase